MEYKKIPKELISNWFMEKMNFSLNTKQLNDLCSQIDNHAKINFVRCCETVANKENKDFFKWVESEKIERISDFYFLIGNKKHTYNYVKKKYRMYLRKKQMFY